MQTGQHADDRPGSGYAALAAAIIGGGLYDLTDHRQRDAARAFFVSPWFDLLAECANLDAGAVRERLRARRLL
jgi:hypothetical protein